MKKKYYWKVVNVEPNGKMVSAIIRYGKYCVEYKIGKISEESVPNNGILVFDTRRRARAFKFFEKCDFKKLIIVKVEAVGVQRDPFFYDIQSLREDQIEESIEMFPNGTVAFSKVKVIEKVS